MNLRDTFLLDIQSYQWWISVVLVGVVIHVAADYIKPFVSKKVFAILKSFRSDLISESETAKRELESLRKSQVKQITLAISEMRHRFLGFFYLVVGLTAIYMLHTFLKEQEKTYFVALAVTQFSAVIFFITHSLDHWFKGIDDGKMLNKLNNWS